MIWRFSNGKDVQNIFRAGRLTWGHKGTPWREDQRLEARDLLADGDPEYSSNPCCLKTWDLEEDDSDFWDLNRSQIQPFIVDQRLWASYTRGGWKGEVPQNKMQELQKKHIWAADIFCKQSDRELEKDFCILKSVNRPTLGNAFPPKKCLLSGIVRFRGRRPLPVFLALFSPSTSH